MMTSHSRNTSDLVNSFSFKNNHLKTMVHGMGGRDKSRNNETHDGILLSTSSLSNYSSNQLPGA